VVGVAGGGCRGVFCGAGLAGCGDDLFVFPLFISSHVFCSNLLTGAAAAAGGDCRSFNALEA